VRFKFELARDLGMTVGELERRMTARELSFWRAFRLAEHDEAVERS
jgi:hypothetical protein